MDRVSNGCVGIEVGKLGIVEMGAGTVIVGISVGIAVGTHIPYPF